MSGPSRAARLFLGAGIALSAASCAEERKPDHEPPVYAEDIAPLLARHCASCHEGDAAAGGWRAQSFLDVIGCVGGDGGAATAPADARAPILRVLESDSHRTLLDDQARAVLDAWVRGGAPPFRATVHAPGIADPRSPDWHGKFLRDKRWRPMLDANDADACGRCHDGAPARPAGVVYPATGATACTTCHAQEGGVLACGTCHGTTEHSYPPRDPCFFPEDARAAGAHAAHVAPTASAEGFACATCHPTPGADVMSGVHGNGAVEIVFDPASLAANGSYDRTTGVCAVACHDRGGARARPSWNDIGPLGCGGCHGSPPARHYPGPCSTCHFEADAAGTMLSGHVLHLNGRVDFGDGSGRCGACHGRGDDPWPSTAAHAAHRNPKVTAPIACSDCHVVPRSVIEPQHPDGRAAVRFSGRAVDRGALAAWDGRTCSSVACHGANLVDPPSPIPAWTDSGAVLGCDTCHRLPPSQHTASTSCDRAECHGSEVVRSGADLSISESGKLLHINGKIDLRPP